MLKSPISILQEFAVQKNLGLPLYEISGSGQAHCMNFICSVKFNGQDVTGMGLTKKAAKHDGASKMLELCGVKINSTEPLPNICLLPTKSKLIAAPVNYIGKLNEFCAGHRYPAAVYIEEQLLINNQFCIKCTFLEFTTKGHGTTKKDAKQDSAKHMLLLIKDKNLGCKPMKHLVSSSVEQNNEQHEEVLQTYVDIMKNLSIRNYHSTNNNLNISNNVENILSNPDILKITSWDDLLVYMERKGWTHQIDVFQHSPLMLRIKINNHYTFIDIGETREEIYHKFFIAIVDQLNRGIDFSEPSVLSGNLKIIKDDPEQ